MDTIKKVYYGYDEFVTDARDLLEQIELYEPDALVAVARGGLALAQLLGEAMDTREVYSINSILYEGTQKLDHSKVFNIPNLENRKKVVLIDDIVDSGDSMRYIIEKLTKVYPHCEFKIGTLFYKKTASIQPDFTVREANEWIEFFWEVDLIKKR
jgi:xanthine phosphoribosyltransferase